jgi:Siphovirus Gp157
MTTLHEITKLYREDLAKIQDLDLPPEVVLDTVEAMQGDFETKVRAVVGFAQELEMVADRRRDLAKAMVDGAKAMENRAESLKSYVQAMISASGIVLPMRLPEFTVDLAKNPQSCEVSDVSKLPPHMVKSNISFDVAGMVSDEVIDTLTQAIQTALHAGVVKIEVNSAADKREVLATLKEGKELEGAKLNPTSFRLSVR